MEPIHNLSNNQDTLSFSRRRTTRVQDEGGVPDSPPWSGLWGPGNSSWNRPLKGTQKELICLKVLLVWLCVCVRVSVWLCVRACVCVVVCARDRDIFVYMYNQIVSLLWLTYLCECNICFGIFHLSYSSVGKRDRQVKKPNKLTFRKIWTVTVFTGIVLAISKNSELSAKNSAFYALCSNRKDNFMSCYSAR